MDTEPSVLRPDLEPTPVEGDNCQLGANSRLRDQAVGFEIVDLLVTHLSQLLAQFVSDSSHLATADVDLGQIGQRLSSGLE